MQHMPPRWSHGGIQHRWNRDHNSIALGSDTALPIPHPHRVNRQVVETGGIEAQMQMQKRTAGWCGAPLPLPAPRHPLGQQLERAPHIGIAHHMLGMDLLSALELNANGALPIEQHTLDAAAQTQFTAMGFQTAHQSHHHSLAAAFGEIQTGIGFKPLAKQGGHRCGIGAAHRQTADQKTKQIHPMAQKRIPQVLIHQRAKGTTEMAHRRQVRQQLSAAAQQLGHHIGSWAKR